MGRQEEIIQSRLKKLKELKSEGIPAYPSKTSKKEKLSLTSEIKEKYSNLKKEEKSKTSYTLAGRLMSSRDLGKIAFGVLNDGHDMIQIVFQSPTTPKKSFEFFRKYIDSGDFISISGNITRTKRGELSILVKSLEILTKSLLPLPEKFHGLKDEEEKLRKRYLDILTDPEIKQIFIRKSKFWNSVRSFLLEKGFLEVETPVLETSAGGAAATPFKTHHNALDLDVYLRISMGELWQKKLMVASYPKTFEIGRQFRNEGMDQDHLQDYTQMEFYMAYKNYKDGMELVEKLYKYLAKSVYGKTRFEHSGMKFDLASKWKTIDFSSEIKKQTSIDIWKASAKDIESKLKELNEPFDTGLPKFRLVDILWKHCRRTIAGPAFLTGQPKELSPLAKSSSSKPGTVEQFQVILAGSEVGNGYSELNDPLDQESRFQEQRALASEGDSEAHPHDKDFVEALKYGMPPTCGFGFSERLFSFLEGRPIRETVIFPLMKPLSSSKDKKTKGGK
jgi:lysyl-tRNA synthetase class 2